jgi:RNA-binding protein
LLVLKSAAPTERSEHEVPESSKLQVLARALSPAERKVLRARAHHLQPVVMLGDAGLTEPVLREIEANLRSHELIKIRVLGDGRATRKDLIGAICEATGAQPVQHIGKMLVVYRARPPEEDTPVKRARPRRKAPRRLKRSYQNT